MYGCTAAAVVAPQLSRFASAMASAAGTRPGHSEPHILRYHVTAKSVEEVIVARRAQTIQNEGGFVPRPPRASRHSRGRLGNRNPRHSARGQSTSQDAIAALMSKTTKVSASKLRSTFVCRTAHSTVSNVQIRPANSVPASVLARRENRQAALQHVSRMKTLITSLDVDTIAPQFGQKNEDRTATHAAIYPFETPAVSKIVRKPSGARMRNCPANARLQQPGTKISKNAKFTTAENEMHNVTRDTDIVVVDFARDLLAGWTSDAIDNLAPALNTPPISIFDRLHHKPTANSARKCRQKVPSQEQILPQRQGTPKIVEESSVHLHGCFVGQPVKICGSPRRLSRCYTDEDSSMAASLNSDFCKALGLEIVRPTDRCGETGEIVDVIDGNCCRIRLSTDGTVLWLPPAALVPLCQPFRPSAPLPQLQTPVTPNFVQTQMQNVLPSSELRSAILVEKEGLTVLPWQIHGLDKSQYHVTIHIDRIPSADSGRNFFVGVVAIDQDIPADAAPFEIRERTFCLESYHSACHREKPSEHVAPTAFHSGSTVSMVVNPQSQTIEFSAPLLHVSGTFRTGAKLRAAEAYRPFVVLGAHGARFFCVIESMQQALEVGTVEEVDL